MDFSIAPRTNQPWRYPGRQEPLNPSGAAIKKVPTKQPPNINVKVLILSSSFFLGVQHGIRMAEEKTRRELDGPFFDDWFRAAGTWQGWNDNGKKFTNWVAHPLQGSVYATLFAHSHRQSINARFGRNRNYWSAKGKQFLYAFLMTEMFELGPASEASLGNVNQAGIDHVLTPTLGTAISIAEDAADHYFVRDALRNHRVWGKFLACTITPTKMVANAFAFRALWYRAPREDELPPPVPIPGRTRP